MDIILPAFFIVMIIELMLSISWNIVYFNFGIPIFIYEIPHNYVEIENKNSIEIQNLVESNAYNSLIFNQQTNNSIAFREVLMSGESKLPSIPIMRGNIKYTERGKVKVTGYIYWSLILFFLLYISLLMNVKDEENIDILLVLFPMVIFWDFFRQKKKYIRIAEIAAGKS